MVSVNAMIPLQLALCMTRAFSVLVAHEVEELNDIQLGSGNLMRRYPKGGGIMSQALHLRKEGIASAKEFRRIGDLLRLSSSSFSSNASLSGDATPHAVSPVDNSGSRTSVSSRPTPLWKSLYHQHQHIWSSKNYNNLYAMRSCVPMALLYVLEKYPDVTRVTSDLRIHVIGAAFAFEGRSDWKMFRNLLRQARPEVKRLHVLMDLATPWLADNSVAVKSKHADTDNPDDKFNSMRQAQWHTRDVCFEDVEDGLFVHCVYGLYQDVVVATHKHEPPDLAFMSNPGLGQPQRRTFDPALRYLFSRNVTIVISTTQGIDAANGLGHIGSSLDLAASDGETLHAASVMNAYGAALIQTSVSPFPMNVGSVGGENDEITLKDSVLSVYKGYQQGRTPCEPEPLPQHELNWLMTNIKSAAIYQTNNFFDPSFASVMLLPVCPAMERGIAQYVIKQIQNCPPARNRKQVNIILEKLIGEQEPRVKVWDWPTICGIKCFDDGDDDGDIC